MKNLLLILFLSSLLFSCKSKNETTETENENKISDKNYVLTAFEDSPEYPDAELEFNSYKDGIFEFEVDSDTYELGEQTSDAARKMCANSKEGQHIHLIMGSDPYYAKYTATFNQDIRDGEHYMLAFLSRSYHESIKTRDAFISYKVKIKDNTVVNQEPIEGMMLWYSRPKGVYIGKEETERVMLDFYLKDVTLGDEFAVKADINGGVHSINRWQPYYIDGLPLGKNTITLTLVDNQGKTVNIPNNPVSMEFELKSNPEDELVQ